MFLPTNLCRVKYFYKCIIPKQKQNIGKTKTIIITLVCVKGGKCCQCRAVYCWDLNISGRVAGCVIQIMKGEFDDKQKWPSSSDTYFGIHNA